MQLYRHCKDNFEPTNKSTIKCLDTGVDASKLQPANNDNWSATSAGHPAEADQNGQNAYTQEQGFQADKVDYYPELILDPSGQWYWEHGQQQWLPYYPEPSPAQPDQAGQASAVQASYDPESSAFAAQQQGDNAEVQAIENGMASLEVEPAAAAQYSHEDAMRSRQDSEVSGVSQPYPPPNQRQQSVESSVGYHYPEAGQVEGGQWHGEGQVGPAAEDGGIVNQVYDHSSGMGPPDLVDHTPNAQQPEIVSDLSRAAGPTLAGPVPPPSVPSSSVPPPDMFASLPTQAVNSPNPDLTPSPSQTNNTPERGAPGGMEAVSSQTLPGPPTTLGTAQLDLDPRPPDREAQGAAHAAPDLTAQSVIQNLGQHSSGARVEEPLARATTHDQHYDFYKGQIESAMPDLMSGRSGVLPPPTTAGGDFAPQQEVQPKAPDILRTEPVVPTSDRNLFMETGELREEDANRVSYQHHDNSSPPNIVNSKPPSGLPPMVGGNEPPTLIRMVVGESVTSAQPPPAAPSQRLVEGGATQTPPPPPPNIPQPIPAREVEGEAVQDSRSFANPRTIEGEDGSDAVVLPPPVRTREVEGQPMSLPMVPRAGSAHPVIPPQEQEFGSSIPSTPLESSPTHMVSQAEVRSAAAGSDRRDQTVMGGPPAAKAPPLPTPGRAVAGQESSAPYGARRRGDTHKKSTYDSDDDRHQDSDSERERELMRPQPRRNISPGARSVRSRPPKSYERMNRSSTEREEDSGRKPLPPRDSYRDRRGEDPRGYRKDSSRHEPSRRYRGESRRYYEDDDDIFDDRRSLHGGGGSRKFKEEPMRYRDDHYYRRHRNDSDYERESYYGDDLNR